MSHPYTRAEFEHGVSDWPDRGEKCSRCKTIVPEFSELTEELAASIAAQSDAGDPAGAYHRMAELLGAPLRYAKIWVLHNGERALARHRDNGPPCPKCGEPLISDASRQCLTCHASWHGRTDGPT